MTEALVDRRAQGAAISSVLTSAPPWRTSAAPSWIAYAAKPKSPSREPHSGFDLHLLVCTRDGLALVQCEAGEERNRLELGRVHRDDVSDVPVTVW